jgi:hypothetical protein
VSKPNRVWQLRKASLRREVESYVSKGPSLEQISVADFGSEIRWLLRFRTETLIRLPGETVQRAGPVVAGVRYHERFLAEAPIPWEIVSLLHPVGVFHPNVNAAGALCLGHPPAGGVPLGLVLHMTWAALVFNLRVVDTVDWHGLNPEAAAYVRANREMFPLTERGLFEPLEDPGKQEKDR